MTECGSFSSALLCQRCANGRSPILPLPPKPTSTISCHEEDEEEEEEGAKWRCADCGYAVDAAFARTLQDRLREELEAAKCEDPQVQYVDTNRSFCFPPPISIAIIDQNSDN